MLIMILTLIFSKHFTIHIVLGKFGPKDVLSQRCDTENLFTIGEFGTKLGPYLPKKL